MNKYNAVRTTLDNVTFDSKAEATRYWELKMLLKAGLILELSRQPKFTLQEAFKDRNGEIHRPIKYVADFKYYDVKFKCVVIEDTKGMKTELYKVKKKLFLNKFPEYIFIES